MNYGLYLSASGVLTATYRQDVFANNLANVQTVGFKPDRPSVLQRASAAQEGGQPSEFQQQLLDRLGGGALAGPQTVDLTQGSLQTTGNPLDAALVGQNAFFAVQAPGADGQQTVRLTRDGRFSLDAKGDLVTATDGMPVLDASNQPITLRNDAPVRINAQGQIIQDGQIAATLQVTAVRDPLALAKQGHNTLWSKDGADPRTGTSSAVVESGHVEAGGVDAIRAMVDMMNATRDVNFNSNLLKYHDQLTSQAVNTLGRVA